MSLQQREFAAAPVESGVAWAKLRSRPCVVTRTSDSPCRCEREIHHVQWLEQGMPASIRQRRRDRTRERMSGLIPPPPMSPSRVTQSDSPFQRNGSPPTTDPDTSRALCTRPLRVFRLLERPELRNSGHSIKPQRGILDTRRGLPIIPAHLDLLNSRKSRVPG